VVLSPSTAMTKIINRMQIFIRVARTLLFLRVYFKLWLQSTGLPKQLPEFCFRALTETVCKTQADGGSHLGELWTVS